MDDWIHTTLMLVINHTKNKNKSKSDGNVCYFRMINWWRDELKEQSPRRIEATQVVDHKGSEVAHYSPQTVRMIGGLSRPLCYKTDMEV